MWDWSEIHIKPRTKPITKLQQHFSIFETNNKPTFVQQTFHILLIDWENYFDI